MEAIVYVVVEVVWWWGWYGGRCGGVVEVVVEVVDDAVVEVERKIVCDAGHGSVRSTTTDCTMQHSPGPKVEEEARPSLSWKYS